MSNYRGITLLNSAAKLMSGILAQRLQLQSEVRNWLQEEQGGFRVDRGSNDQVFSLREIIAERIERDDPTIVLFLDAEKAYDKVWQDGLLAQFRSLGVTGKAYRLIRSNLEYYIRCMKDAPEDDEDRYFRLSLGLPQGAPESCFLFNLYIDSLIVELRERGIGIMVGRRRHPGLWFCDDIALILKDVAELRLALQVVNDFASRFRISFNGSPKSAVMVFGTGAQAIRDEINSAGLVCTGKRISTVDSYKYLGIWFQNNLRFSQHVEYMVRKASRVSGFISFICRKGRGTRPRTALYIWNQVCRPLLEFGCEIWAPILSDAHRVSLNQVHKDFLRACCNAPARAPIPVLYLELGQVPLQGRWDKLTLGFAKRACKNRRRILWEVFSRAMETNTRQWPVYVNALLRSCYRGPLPIPDQLYTRMAIYDARGERIDARDEFQLRAQAHALPSLENYCRIRHWGRITKEYAWALTHVTRHGHRFLEPYLDDWDHGKECRAKMRFRSGCQEIAWQLSKVRRGALDASRCYSCHLNAPESANHFLFLCPAYDAPRATLYRTVRLCMQAAQDTNPQLEFTVQDFFEARHQVRLQFLMGRRSGCLALDKSLDRAAKRFLKEALVIRDAMLDTTLPAA